MARYVYRLVLGVLLATIASVAVAYTPVGIWKGQVAVDTAGMQAQPTPALENRFRQRITEIKKMAFRIVFNADHTFKGTSTRGTRTLPPQTGTWSQSKNVVTITASPKGRDGKAHHQVFVFSGDGKTLTAKLPAAAGVKANLVLVR